MRRVAKTALRTLSLTGDVAAVGFHYCPTALPIHKSTLSRVGCADASRPPRKPLRAVSPRAARTLRSFSLSLLALTQRPLAERATLLLNTFP